MKFDIVRAWKDESYRQQLSSEEQALLPANPAGELEVSDADLEAVHGARGGLVVNSVAYDCEISYDGGCISFSGETCGEN